MNRVDDSHVPAAWALEAAALASGFGSRVDVEAVSSDWLGLNEVPDGLFPLADLDGDETTEEILLLAAPIYEGLGLRLEDLELVGLLASARWLSRRREYGNERVAHVLASLAINFRDLEVDLIDATLASSAIDDNLQQSAETNSRLDLSRSAILAHLERVGIREDLHKAIVALASGVDD